VGPRERIERERIAAARTIEIVHHVICDMVTAG
jgi:hypothetical protein